MTFKDMAFVIITMSFINIVWKKERKKKSLFIVRITKNCMYQLFVVAAYDSHD